MKAIGRFIKFIFWTVIVLVLLAVVAVLTIPWWVGPTVTGVANFAVPKIVKADFSLNRFEFNQYKGTFGLGDVKLANPEGFAPENCLELDAFDVKFDPVSCFTKKIHIEKISLDGLRVVAEFPSAGNFQKIAENAQGGPAEKETKDEEPGEECKDKDGDVKVVIDVVEVKNLKVTYGAAPIVVPDFTLSDIGKEEGGVEFCDAMFEIYKSICDKCGIVVGAVLDAGKAVVDTGVEAAGAVMDAGKAVVDNGVEAAGAVMDAGTEAANAAADAVKDSAGAAVDVVGKGLDAVGDGAGAAVDAVGKGLDAVGDGAGAAVDAVKGIFGK